MPRRKKAPLTQYPVLTPRQGKSLRFIVSRTVESVYKSPVEVVDLTIKTYYSTDLPQTPFAAKLVLQQLRGLKLIEHADKTDKRKGKGFLATELGIGLIKQANAAGLWRD